MIYDVNGELLSEINEINGNSVDNAYDVEGNLLDTTFDPYKYGTPYSFSGMTMTDSEGVTAVSSVTKNSETSIAYTPTIGGNIATPVEDYEKVYFTCNIPTGGQDFGIWMYVPPESVPCYGGKTTHGNGIAYFRVSINQGSWVVTQYTSLKVGWSFFYIENSSINTITSIGFCAINGVAFTSPSTIILDSIEVGFSCKKAHIMFNLDCVPSNFWDVGYPLFEEYGLRCTLHYPISTTSANVGADSDYLDVTKHNELLSKGYEFATYSGWQTVEGYGDAVPFYDNESKRSVFEAHAERMWHVNNNSDIYAPVGIHSTGFLFGYEYLNACLDYDFLMVRQGVSNGNGACFTYYDNEKRCMIPYFIQNIWEADDQRITALKSTIDYAVQTKQNLQIGFHAIKGSSYTPTSGDIYIGVDAVEEILKYVKSYMNQNKLTCCTTKNFIREMSPDLYDRWLTQRNHEVVQ